MAGMPGGLMKGGRALEESAAFWGGARATDPWGVGLPFCSAFGT